MSHHFRLSNRQRKDLYVRSTAHLIAIPLTASEWRDAPRDPDGMARRLLPDVDETIQSVEIGAVQHGVPIGDGKARSLTDVLGPIGDMAQLGLISIRSEVLLVWLWHGEPRHKKAEPQWPGNMVVDGKPLIEVAAD